MERSQHTGFIGLGVMGEGIALNVAHRLIFMHNGEIWEPGPARTLLDEPKTPDLRNLMGVVLV